MRIYNVSSASHAYPVIIGDIDEKAHVAADALGLLGSEWTVAARAQVDRHLGLPRSITGALILSQHPGHVGALPRSGSSVSHA